MMGLTIAMKRTLHPACQLGCMTTRETLSPLSLHPLCEPGVPTHSAVPCRGAPGMLAAGNGPAPGGPQQTTQALLPPSKHLLTHRPYQTPTEPAAALPVVCPPTDVTGPQETGTWPRSPCSPGQRPWEYEAGDLQSQEELQTFRI